MFEHILRPLWAIVNQTVSKDSKFRKMAGIAFICLVMSVGCGFATAWISFPVYESMFRNPMYDSLFFAIGFAAVIAVSMFYFMTTIGYYITEKFRGIPSILPASLVATVMILGLCLGSFDAIQGARQGAKIRAKQVFKSSTFAESQVGLEKPYETDIANIDKQIEALQADKIKGEMRWGNQKKIDKLINQRDSYVSMQMQDLTEMRTAHSVGQADLSERRESGAKNLSWFQACLYLLQIVLTIPLANFDIEVDGADGKRDGSYDLGVDPVEDSAMGFAWGIKPEKYPVTNKNNPVGYQFQQRSRNDAKRGINRGINTPNTPSSQPNSFAHEPPVVQDHLTETASQKLQQIMQSRTPSTDKDSAFLRKWKPAVIMVVSGKTIGEIKQEMDNKYSGISKSTIQNIRRCLRAKGIIEDYKQ